jgi:hypothetical protein
VPLRWDAGNVKEGSSFPGGKQPGPEPKAPQRTRINKSFKFGPAARDPVRFRLTVAVPDLRVRDRVEQVLFSCICYHVRLMCQRRLQTAVGTLTLQACSFANPPSEAAPPPCCS